MSTATMHPPVSQAQRLAAEAAAAAELRTYRTDPDVVALRVEHIRGQVDRLMWAGIVLGLCFTMTNVQQFAATGAAIGSLAWWSAWLLDPMVSLVLLAVLRAEQVTTRYQVTTGVWPRVAKWALLSATYVMNTWVSWAAGSASGVILHTVAPLVVVIAAEAVTDLQYALSECVQRAHTTATTRAAHTQPETVVVKTSTPARPVLAGGVGDHPACGVGDRFTGAAGERAQVHSVNPATAVAGRAAGRVGEPRRAPRKRSAGSVRRKLLADYLAEARTAWSPGVVVSPAWVRHVTGCSRGLSPKVAAALTAELPAGRHHTTVQTEPEGRAA
ncbi:MAG TPA: hypothetical protein VHY21_00765 [Pseudonocardiaceae bacterium]|jgi:hypothetical protein|nr:hypothetical protein [Pseudonocardiaceae bacterium]